MAYIVTFACVDVLDKACIDVCPVDCIYVDEGVDRMVFIEPDECIDCAACEPVCPVTAIYAEDDVPEEENDYVAVNYDYFQKSKDDARAKVDEIAGPPSS